MMQEAAKICRLPCVYEVRDILFLLSATPMFVRIIKFSIGGRSNYRAIVNCTYVFPEAVFEDCL